jgi:hypothetical protein
MALTVARESITARVPALGLDLAVIDYSVSLDDSRTPYAEVSLTCSRGTDYSVARFRDLTAALASVETFEDFDDLFTGDTFGDFDIWARELPRLPAVDAGAIDAIDPRAGLRVEVTLIREGILPVAALQTRALDLYLHAAEPDAGKGTVTLTCRSDEAMAIDDMLGGTSVDSGAETHQGSLRAIIDYVLAPLGATLEPGDVDADFTLSEEGRDPDALKREPGERAWDFLSPLVDAAGLHLYCDEQRRWHLVDLATNNMPGSLRISDGHNVISARSSVDLSAGDRGVLGYAETVVVKYTWTDGDGVQQVAYDSAGAAHGIGRLVEVARPFPGAGAAAALLKKSEGKGRTLDLQAVNDFSATPGQTLVATIPNTPLQVGIVSSVEWGSDGTMRVGSRGLTDTPETAWALQPEGYAWEDVPTGQDWTEYETP